MKKVLIVATVVKKHIMQFHIPTLQMFKGMGWETHVAGGNDYSVPSDCRIPCCDVYHEIDFARFPFHPKNIASYIKLRKIINEGKYDLIHCHTPVGSILTRLAAGKARKKGTKVFYTAHGFHFFKGAPLLNWLLYYPAEWLCSHFTDVLITMNFEDFGRAKKLKAKATEFINGVGIDLERMKATFKTNLPREAFNLKDDDIVLLSVGELTVRKNHKTILRAISNIKNDKVHYIIAGEGKNRKRLEDMAKNLGIAENVHFLGYRKDVYSLVKMSDIFCFPSYQEGLPVALMEAMAGGLPVVASGIRGNIDLIDEGKGGFLYHPDDVEGFAEGIKRLMASPKLIVSLREYNLKKIEGYDVSAVCASLRSIYEQNGVAL